MTLVPGTRAGERPALAPFQAEAVEAILTLLSGRGGALLADGAGLGKSWVAASVARAWEDRGGTSQIVAPAALLAQWREVADMFGLAAALVSHDAGNVGMPASGAERLVIVDEAHRFRNPRTRRYRRLAMQIRADSVLLVTATPICNAPEELRTLLGLLVADDALADRGVPSLDETFRVRSEARLRVVLDELAIARDRDALPDSLRFAATETTTIVYRAAGRHGRELEEAFESLRFPLVDPLAAGMLRAFLWRRLESSAAALRATLDRLRKLHARALECATRGVALTRASYRAAFGDPDSTVFQDILFPELWGAGVTGVPLDAGEIRRELEALEGALSVVGMLLAADPKVSIVSRVVDGMRGKRGLVFTQSRDTARALWGALRARTRCGIVTGTRCRDGTGRSTSMESVFEMLAREALDVVVATDVGCEGLNLQAATWVVHADLPWSPARLEQRLGRVSRIGQRTARIEEFVTTAEGSPVQVALARKSDDVLRFGPRRRSDVAARVPLHIDAGSVAECDDALCVVDLVERCGGRVLRALRGLDVAGDAGSFREGSGLARGLSAQGLGSAGAWRRQVDDAVAAWVEIVRGRELQPPRLDGASPQFRLVEAAAQAGVLSSELVQVLARRYRAGTEMLIAAALEGPLDTSAVAALMRALKGEVRGGEPYDATIAGFVATRGWLRSAALRRRGRH